MNPAIVQKTDPEVEQALASIRKVMFGGDIATSKESKTSEIINFPSSKINSEKNYTSLNRGDVLLLTEMITNDGSIISLKGGDHKMTATSEKKVLDNSAIQENEKSTDKKTEVAENRSEEYTPSRNDTMELSEEQQVDLEISTPSKTIQATREEIESIMSAEAVSQSKAAFNDLEKLTEHMKIKIQDGTFGAQTIDQLMREMLRPLLKEWLDSHLPSLVKWLVAEKIEQMMKEKQEKSI